ncbi:DUF3796 domain-containing protein [Patescibacteria group bacterium]|jgi:hypothetical protein|nr:DUF3796 domain-containing protein [Patescibacteria group bacterium]
MKKNKLAYLGLLGLIGLLGIPTGNYGLFGFFGLFGFLGLLFTKNDELLEQNIGKAASSAFAVSVVGLATTMALTATLESIDVAMVGVAATFVAQILTYTFSISWYEHR